MERYIFINMIIIPVYTFWIDDKTPISLVR